MQLDIRYLRLLKNEAYKTAAHLSPETGIAHETPAFAKATARQARKQAKAGVSWAEIFPFAVEIGLGRGRRPRLQHQRRAGS